MGNDDFVAVFVSMTSLFTPKMQVSKLRDIDLDGNGKTAEAPPGLVRKNSSPAIPTSIRSPAASRSATNAKGSNSPRATKGILFLPFFHFGECCLLKISFLRNGSASVTTKQR